MSTYPVTDWELEELIARAPELLERWERALVPPPPPGVFLAPDDR